jgi:hypothetical protein
MGLSSYGLRVAPFVEFLEFVELQVVLGGRGLPGVGIRCKDSMGFR